MIPATNYFAAGGGAQGVATNGLTGLPPAVDPIVWSSMQNYGQGLPTTLNDGNCLIMSLSGALTLNNAAGAAIWTKGATAINASATSIIPNLAWIDAVDSPVSMYVIAVNSTMLYPAKIALATGVVTPLGAGITMTAAGMQSGVMSGGYMVGGSMFRAAQGSGDLSLYWIFGTGGSQQTYVCTISSTTGALTGAATQVTSNGVAVFSGYNTGVAYRSADGTLLVANPLFGGGSSVSNVLLPIFRNGKYAWLPLNNGVPSYASVQNGSTSSYFTPLGSTFTVCGSVVVSPSRVIPVMLRTTWDAYLAQCASNLGI